MFTTERVDESNTLMRAFSVSLKGAGGVMVGVTSASSSVVACACSQVPAVPNVEAKTPPKHTPLRVAGTGPAFSRFRSVSRCARGVHCTHSLSGHKAGCGAESRM